MPVPDPFRPDRLVTEEPPPRRGRRVRTWWPAGLAVTFGLVLLLHRWHWITLSAALEALVVMVFATAVAGAVLGGFMQFLLWWFWSRRRP